ncbi:MAG: hypothetical protein C4539_10065 [Ignavibacteriales bacterium]|nr:MAG: hypothetical protein C4539_10065 [Ignavibacteriales bacterium]
MKNYYIYIIPLFLLLTAFSDASSTKEKTVINSHSYFPINKNITLIYKSSFGESVTTYFRNGEFTISSSESEKFKYKQTLLIKDDGVYVSEIYQYLKIFLFIKKEATFTYGKPLLRFPLPLTPGINWVCEGVEYSDGDMNKVKVTGKALDKEFVITKAGRFEAIKLESLIEGTANAKNRVTEWYAEGIGLIKAKIIIEGGGVMGFLRDMLGYGTIEFELQEIRKQ